MKVKSILTVKATIKKQKTYNFDIDREDIKKAKRATYDKPHRIQKGTTKYDLYLGKNGKLQIEMLHSFDIFEEVEETKQSDINKEEMKDE